MQFERLDEQHRQLCDTRPDVQTAPARSKPRKQGFSDTHAETATGLSFGSPENISAFITVDAGEPPIIEALKHCGDREARGSTDSS
jgi:hypothetical protein